MFSGGRVLQTMKTTKFFYTVPFLGGKRPFFTREHSIFRENNLFVRETPFSIPFPITVVLCWGRGETSGLWREAFSHKIKEGPGFPGQVFGEKLSRIKLDKGLVFQVVGFEPRSTDINPDAATTRQFNYANAEPAKLYCQFIPTH